MTRSVLSKAFILVLVAAPAWAATFTVGVTSDGADLAPGDGICDANPSQLVVCTLRAAFQEAIALPGEHLIQMSPGVHVLTIEGGDDEAAVGDLDVQTVITVTGAGAGETEIQQTVDGNRVLDVRPSGFLTLRDLTVSGGTSTADGGGIRNQGQLDLHGVEITGNRAQVGGGIFNVGSLFATRIEVAGNTATERAGGIASVPTASSPPLAEVSLGDSTIGPNTSMAGPTELELANALQATLVNVTVSPIDVEDLATEVGDQDVDIVFSTLRGRLRALSVDGSHTLRLSRSAVEACDFAFIISLPVIERLGVNASRDGSCGFGAAGGIEAPLQLGPLADNGGPTPTHLPQPGSPLIDAAGISGCPAADQRGTLRPQDGDGVGGAACDVGAVEVPEPAAIFTGLAALGALASLGRRDRELRERGRPTSTRRRACPDPAARG